MKLFDTHAHCDDSRIASEFEGGTDGYIKHQLENTVYEEELRDEFPHKHYVDMTEKVYNLRKEMYENLHG